MTNISTSNVYRDRMDFAKIHTSIPIPNLIEVQRKSYHRFLQMDVPPSEREDVGLQAVFNSVFPINDFRGTSSLEFVEYSIGNWQCKCGNLKGLNYLRAACDECGKAIVNSPYNPESGNCRHCGAKNEVENPRCEFCGGAVELNVKYTVEECQERGMTFAVPLKVTVRLVVWDKDTDTEGRTIRDIKEQEVYFGDIPLMTENGTFIINGTERVIVSQLHRSPGVFFESNAGRTFILAKIIPYRGSWVEFEYDQKNILYVRIDRKRKFLATTFLRALGLSLDADILRTFYEPVKIRWEGQTLFRTLGRDLIGTKATDDIKDAKGRSVVVAKGKKITEGLYHQLAKGGVTEMRMELEGLEGAISLSEVINQETGEILVESNSEVTSNTINALSESNIDHLHVFFPEREEAGTTLSLTLRKDHIKSQSDALIEIYRKQRPGDPPTLETATALFEGMFYDPRKYDFSKVGRLKFNIKLGLNTPLEQRTLTADDFYAVIKYALKLTKNIGEVDDIDHLGNRRVRAVGELLENQFRIGLVRMERAIKEKMSVHQEMTTAMPHDLINAKPVMASIREFFGSSQLSQFMDQTNPLSEITHKRRLSALGPGGLSRERAGFEVRDVHPTHYGRICPIETPEGPNIGLISSLSCFARINEYGFIESPYRKVKDGRVMDYVLVSFPGDTHFKMGDPVEVEVLEKENHRVEAAGKRPAQYESFSFYQTAWEAEKYTIAQANVDINEKGVMTRDRVNARMAGNFSLVPREQVQYIDVSPKQLVSVAASLIPFLEHDDANRALMGSNMQRQAVPLLNAEAPYIGTGMEHITAKDSGAVVICKRAGVVDSVDSTRIIVRVEGDSDNGKAAARDAGVDIYALTKFKR